jgi:Na+-transporting NADH:ubiquinone oxidoreductase subunit NqrC
MSETDNKDLMEDSNKKKKGGEKESPKKVVIFIVLTVVIMALIGVIIYLLMPKQEEAQEQDKRNVVITKDNLDEVISQMSDAEYVAPGYYTVTMNNVWHFENGNPTSSDAYVENTVENLNDVYFDVFLAEDETTAIYESPVIPRGASLQEISLKEPLEVGSYDCVMVYHLIDDDQNTLSTLRVSITLVVQ